MVRFHVPGVSLAIVQENKHACSLALGGEEKGTAREVRAESIFHACSMSKLVTAIAVLRLVQAGLMDLEEDANVYLRAWKIPENQFTYAKKVTVGSLLAHQSGFIDPEGSFDVCREGASMPSLLDLLTGRSEYHAVPAAISYVPDSQFHYSDLGFSVLELIIEEVTGESFGEAVDKLVLVPLGLRRSFYWNGVSNPPHGILTDTLTAGHDRQGNVVNGTRAHYPNLSGAGLWTTPSEMSAIVLAIMKSWNGDTGSLLTPELAHKMLTSFGCAKQAGLGLFLSQADGEIALTSKGWGVGYQCMLVAYPRLQCGIVVMTNSEPGKPQEEALVGEIIRAVSEVYGWPTV